MFIYAHVLTSDLDLCVCVDLDLIPSCHGELLESALCAVCWVAPTWLLTRLKIQFKQNLEIMKGKPNLELPVPDLVQVVFALQCAAGLVWFLPSQNKHRFIANLIHLSRWVYNENLETKRVNLNTKLPGSFLIGLGFW